MFKKRLLATICLIAGGLLLGLGLESSVSAIECQPDGPIFMAACRPAYQSPPGALLPNLIMTCTTQGNECVPGTASECGMIEGYGHAHEGWCEAFPDDEVPQGYCFNRWAPTIVVMEYHTSACEFYEGQCACVWIIGEHPDQYIAACDCAVGGS